jgi:hypothetical protein
MESRTRCAVNRSAARRRRHMKWQERRQGDPGATAESGSLPICCVCDGPAPPAIAADARAMPEHQHASPDPQGEVCPLKPSPSAISNAAFSLARGGYGGDPSTGASRAVAALLRALSERVACNVPPPTRSRVLPTEKGRIAFAPLPLPPPLPQPPPPQPEAWQ